MTPVMNQHHLTIAGGVTGLVGYLVTIYLHNVQAINNVLQTGLLVLSITAVVIGWVKKGRSK